MRFEYNIPPHAPLDVYLGGLKVCTCEGKNTAKAVRDTLELADTHDEALRQVKTLCELNRRQDSVIYKIVCDALKKGEVIFHGNDSTANQLRATGRQG